MDSIFRNIVLQDHPNTIILSLQSDWSSFGHYTGSCVNNYFRQYDEPSCFPNGTGDEVYYLNAPQYIDSLYASSPETPIAIEVDAKIWDPETGILDLTISARNDGDTLNEQYWFNIIVTENNIVYPHRTDTGCSTPNDTLVPYYKYDYINNWVARRLVYCARGRSLSAYNWPANQTYTHRECFSIDTAWIPENCNIIVDVYKRDIYDSLDKSPIMQAIQVPLTEGSGLPKYRVWQEEIIGVFPNPTTHLANIHISVAEHGNCTLNLYDLNGRIVKTLYNSKIKKGLYNFELLTEQIPAGTYFVVLDTGQGRSTKKLVLR